MYGKVLARVLLGVLIVLSARAENSNFRHEEIFNFGWRYLPLKLEYSSADYTEAGHAWAKVHIPEHPEFPEADDSSFLPVDLPHDAQINLPWFKGFDPARAKESVDVWYRKGFVADPSWRGKRVFLEFDGMALWGDVWLNGRPVGSCEYGSLPICVELTHSIRFDATNVVAVKTYGGKSPASRWYTGCGLNRDVMLKVKPMGVTIARHGIYVTTPIAEADRAVVNIEVALDGWTRRTNNLEIVCRILDPDGGQVGMARRMADRDIRLKRIEQRMPSVEIPTPRRWDIDAPHLYTAEVSLFEDGIAVDGISQAFGIRRIDYSPNFGFQLNGRKVFITGIAGHTEDQGCLGSIGTRSGAERMFRRMKEWGINGVRTAHNAYSTAYLDVADRVGMLVVDELGDKWSDSMMDGNTFTRVPFTQCWYRIIPEWIRRDRNHPSVILWSLGNELQEVECDAGFPTGDWGVTTYKILDTYVKRWDRTRPTTVGLYPLEKGAKFDVGNPEPAELGLATEICSYNYLGMRFAEYSKRHPELILFQSEMGVGNTMHDYYIMDRERTVGLALWGAIDYWGEITAWPQKGWYFGFFSHALEPKPQAGLCKASFRSEPHVSLGIESGHDVRFVFFDNTVGRKGVVSHWNFDAGETKKVYVYTNCEEAELFLNGRSLGRRRNDLESLDRNRIDFDGVPYEPGVLRVVGYNRGQESSTSELHTAGKAVRLKTIVEKSAGWLANGLDYNWVRFYAVDEEGVVDPTWHNRIKVSCAGSATLAGLDDGNHSTEQIFDSGEIYAHEGFAMAVLRAGRESGEVNLFVRPEGLQDFKIKLLCE